MLNIENGPSDTPQTELKISFIPLEELHASPTNQRKHFDPEKIKELAQSIREHSTEYVHGVQSPLLVRISPYEAGKYEIIAGERRFRATLLVLAELQAELSTTLPIENVSPLDKLARCIGRMPVIIRDIDTGAVREMQLIENLQREGLSPMEEARGFQDMLDLPDGGYTPSKIAQKVGIKVDTVLRKLKILRAPKAMIEALEQGKIGETHLAAVATIPGAQNREDAAKKILFGEYDLSEQKQKPLSYRATLELINTQFRRSLAGVVFDLEDAELVKSAGACSNCPFFLKHAALQDADLAAELGGGQGGSGRGGQAPLTCMKPACLEKKNAAALELMKQARPAGGGVAAVVLSAKETAVAFDESGKLNARSKFVQLDARPSYYDVGHYDTSKVAPWRVILEPVESEAESEGESGAEGESVPPVPELPRVLANVPGVGIVELVEREAALEVAKKHPEYGAQFVAAQATGKGAGGLDPAEKAKQQFEKQVEARTRHVLLAFLHEAALKHGADAELALRVFEAALYEAGMDGCKLLYTWCKLEGNGMEMTQADYRAALVKRLRESGAGKPEIDTFIMLAIYAKWIKACGATVASLEPLQELFGFDAKTIRALAVAEVKAEQSAAEKQVKKAKEKAPKNSSDPDSWSADAEAEKTAAADETGKAAMVPAVDPQKEEFGYDAQEARAEQAAECAAVREAVVAMPAVEQEPEGQAAAAEPESGAESVPDALIFFPRALKNWEPADIDLAVGLLKSKSKTIADLIGAQPTPKAQPDAYRTWNSLRMKLQRRAGLSK